MLWMMILVGGGILSLLLVPVLGRGEAWDLDETPDRLRHLKRTRDRVMRTLKDLETDVREGSLSKEDYEEIRALYKKEAIHASRELGRVRETVVRQIKEGPERPLSQEDRQKLEELVARRGKKLEAR